jgi:hypothetical protein
LGVHSPRAARWSAEPTVSLTYVKTNLDVASIDN